VAVAGVVVLHSSELAHVLLPYQLLPPLRRTPLCPPLCPLLRPLLRPLPEREEEDRQTRPTQEPDLAGETGTQGADALAVADALAAADTLAPAEKVAPAEVTLAKKIALPRAKAKTETGPTRRSQRQRRAPTGQ
jgi:hypothetical protein